MEVEDEAVAASNRRGAMLMPTDQTPSTTAPALLWGTRKRLPERRAGYNQKFVITDGEGRRQVFYLRTGEYPDGTLGEIFIDAAKCGTFLRSILEAFAISVSLGLQHGVPLEEYCHAFIGFEFPPSGAVAGDPRLSEALSCLDYVFRELKMTHLTPQGDMPTEEPPL